MHSRWYLIFFVILVATLSACEQSKSVEEYSQSGQSHFDKKEWKSAIIEFKNAIKEDPKNASVRAKLGRSYLKTYSANAAIKELTRAIKLGHNKNELLIPLGRAYRMSGQYDKILEEINVDVSQTATEQARILAHRAAAYLGTDNTKEALNALNKAKQLDDSATEVRLAWAGFEGQRRNIPEQRAWLAPLLERDGGIADAWSQLGQVETQANNAVAAEKAYSRSIELRQLIHRDHVRRALIRVSVNDLEGAQSDINALKNAGANWPMVGHIDGVIAFDGNDIETAKSKFLDVLSRVSTFAPSQYMLGLIYFNDKNFQSAVTLLLNYVSSRPTELRPNLIYAGSLFELNKVEEGMVVLNRLIAKHPENHQTLTLLGYGHVLQGRPDKANEILKRAVALTPEQADTRFRYGATLLSDESTRAQGQQELMAAIELDPDLFRAELILFRSYLSEKQLSNALDLAINQEKKNPGDSTGANMVARTYLADGKKDKSVAKLNETLKQFPGDLQTTNNLARIHLQDNSLATAKELYRSILETDSSNLEALNQLAVIAIREKNNDQMMLRLTQAQERNPDQISPRLSLVSQYLRQNENIKAIDLLNGAKPEQKEVLGYVLLLAQAKLAVGEQQHAERLLKKLIAHTPDITAAHFLLARSYAANNKSEKMRSSLNKTIELQPNHFAANVIMAKLDLFEGKVDAFKNRVALLDKAFPENQQVRFFKAKIASGESNYAGAIDTLSSLMAETPNTEIIIDLSANQWQTGDKPGAISGLQLWTEEHPDDSKAIMLLAQFYMAEDRLEDAKQAYEALNVFTGDDPVVLNNLAWLLGDTNPEQGIIYAEKALSLSPDNAFTQDTLAMLYLKTKEYDKALDYSTKAATALPKIAEVQFNYASILAANNQVDKAKELLNDMLKKTTKEQTKQLIREQLDQL
jgi:putative PEP-CTERM system TPR-repeat lipoprotein